MVEEHRLAWPTVDVLHSAVAVFLDPVLSGREGTWNPAAWSWG